MLRRTAVTSTEKSHSFNSIFALFRLSYPAPVSSYVVMGKIADGNLSTVQTMTRSRAFENDSDSDALRVLSPQPQTLNPSPTYGQRSSPGAVLSCLSALFGLAYWDILAVQIAFQWFLQVSYPSSSPSVLQKSKPERGSEA